MDDDASLFCEHMRDVQATIPKGCIPARLALNEVRLILSRGGAITNERIDAALAALSRARQSLPEELAELRKTLDEARSALARLRPQGSVAVKLAEAVRISDRTAARFEKGKK